MNKDKIIDYILDFTFYGGLVIMLVGLLLFLNN